MTRPLFVCFVEMNFNKEMESRKTRKVYRRREKKRVLVSKIHTGRLRKSESHAFMVVSITYMGHFFWVSPGQSASSAWLLVRIWYNSASSPVCVHLLAKMDSSTENCGKFDTTYYGVAPVNF